MTTHPKDKVPWNFLYSDSTKGGMGGYFDLDNMLFPVSDEEIHAALFEYIDAYNFVEVTAQMQAGSLSLPVWQTEMRAMIKDGHLAAVALTVGGWENMTFADFGRAGWYIREQYQYLDNWANEIAAGIAPMDGRLLARAQMYENAVYRTYAKAMLVKAKAVGMFQRKSVLDIALAHEDHCSGCLAAADLGWVLLDDERLPDIGDRNCLTNCRCTMKYRTFDEANLDAMEAEMKEFSDQYAQGEHELEMAEAEKAALAKGLPGAPMGTGTSTVNEWQHAYDGWKTGTITDAELKEQYDAMIMAGYEPEDFVNVPTIHKLSYAIATGSDVQEIPVEEIIPPIGTGTHTVSKWMETYDKWLWGDASDSQLKNSYKSMVAMGYNPEDFVDVPDMYKASFEGATGSLAPPPLDWQEYEEGFKSEYEHLSDADKLTIQNWEGVYNAWTSGDATDADLKELYLVMTKAGYDPELWVGVPEFYQAKYEIATGSTFFSDDSEEFNFVPDVAGFTVQEHTAAISNWKYSYDKWLKSSGQDTAKMLQQYNLAKDVGVIPELHVEFGGVDQFHKILQVHIAQGYDVGKWYDMPEIGDPGFSPSTLDDYLKEKFAELFPEKVGTDAELTAKETADLAHDEWDKVWNETYYENVKTMSTYDATTTAQKAADGAANQIVQTLEVIVPIEYQESYAGELAYVLKFKETLSKSTYLKNTELSAKWAVEAGGYAAIQEQMLEGTPAANDYNYDYPTEAQLEDFYNEDVEYDSQAKAWQEAFHKKFAELKVVNDSMAPGESVMTEYQLEAEAIEFVNAAQDKGELSAAAELFAEEIMEEAYAAAQELKSAVYEPSDEEIDLMYDAYYNDALVKYQNDPGTSMLTADAYHNLAKTQADFALKLGNIKELAVVKYGPKSVPLLIEPTEKEMADYYDAMYKNSMQQYLKEAQTTPMPFATIEKLAKMEADAALESGWIKQEIIAAKISAMPSPTLESLKPAKYASFENYISEMSESELETYKTYLVENEFSAGKISPSAKYYLTQFDNTKYYERLLVTEGKTGIYAEVAPADVFMEPYTSKVRALSGQTLSAHDQQYLALNWYKRGENVKYHSNVTAAKHYVVTRLSAEAGISYENADKFIHQWAADSNGSSYTSMAIQKIAGEVFENDMSGWQNGQYIGALKSRNESIEGEYGIDYRSLMISENRNYPGTTNERNYDTPMEANEAMVRAIYENTQSELDTLREAGVTHVTLYRGIRPRTEERRPDRGTEAQLDSNMLESWSTSEEVAGRQFGWGHIGRVLKMTVPLDRVYSTARTGIGCLDEYEWVLIKDTKDVFYVMETEW